MITVLLSGYGHGSSLRQWRTLIMEIVCLLLAMPMAGCCCNGSKAWELDGCLHMAVTLLLLLLLWRWSWPHFARVPLISVGPRPTNRRHRAYRIVSHGNRQPNVLARSITSSSIHLLLFFSLFAFLPFSFFYRVVLIIFLKRQKGMESSRVESSRCGAQWMEGG